MKILDRILVIILVVSSILLVSGFLFVFVAKEFTEAALDYVKGIGTHVEML